MRSSIRVALALVTLFLPAAINEAGAQEVTREIFVTQDADYSGFDLRAEKNISLDDCKKICIEDPACKAFTYNTKVSWCFLKSDFRDATDYKGAIAGRVVETATVVQAPLEPDLGAAPALNILPRGAADEARQFARRASQFAAAADQSSGEDPMAAMRTAMNTRAYPESETLALTALGLDPQNVENYLEFTRMALSFASSNADNSWRMRDLAVAGAINAYEVSRTASKRAEALTLMGKAFEARSQYRAAINSYKTSLELVNSPETAGRYRSARSSYGFRITGNTVDADNTAPRACVQFSEELVKSGVDYNNFVTIDGKPGAIEATGSNICVEGLEHGKSYTIALRAGLPSSVAEVLEEPAVFNIYVRDRAPAVRFTGENFVLPGAARQGIPVIGINADKAKLELFRIGDRSIAPLLAQSRFLRQLEGYTLEQMQGEMGTPVWKGELDLERTLNRETVTSLPLDKVMPERKPGIYVLVAQAEGAETDSWEPRATQWFLISDIGLSTYSGIDGLSVFTRSLDTAGPIAGVELTLIARNNEVLGTATSDANGFARFDAGLLRGTAGSAAAVVTARHAGAKGEDYVFLNLERAGFDLSDRGVTGRAAPGPVDVYAYLDRGIYRLGETVNAMALARDDSANAQGGLPLTIVFERPDGVEATRIVSSSPSEGGHLAQYTLPETGMRGVWKLLAFTDPDAEAVVEKLFLVEDFIPDRIEFDIKTQSAAIAPGSPAMLEIDGRFLYGAPANDLALEGEIRLKAGRSLAAAPGYEFGLSEEEDLGAEAVTLADLPRTGDDGKAMIEAVLRNLPVSSRPLSADISLRMREDGGRAVERKLTLPVTPEGVMVGIKPEFADGVVRENSQAGFSVIAVDPLGGKVDKPGLKWTLSRIERNYQWYRDGSYWRYEATEIPRLEQEGTIDVAAGQPGCDLRAGYLGPVPARSIEPRCRWPGNQHCFRCGILRSQRVRANARRAGNRARQGKLRGWRDGETSRVAALCRRDARCGRHRPVGRDDQCHRSGRRERSGNPRQGRVGRGRLCDGDAVPPGFCAGKPHAHARDRHHMAAGDAGRAGTQGVDGTAGKDDAGPALLHSAVGHRRQGRRGNLRDRRHGRCRDTQPHPLRGARSGVVVFRPTPARPRNSRYLRQSHRWFARRVRQRAHRRRRSWHCRRKEARRPKNCFRCFPASSSWMTRARP